MKKVAADVTEKNTAAIVKDFIPPLSTNMLRHVFVNNIRDYIDYTANNLFFIQ